MKTPNQEILNFINLANQHYETSSGNCGVFAIALHQVFGEGDFLLVENDAYPEGCYHVAFKQDGIIYDGSGVVELEEHLLVYGFDEDYPEEQPRVVEVTASEDMYRWIDRGTDHSQKPEDFIALIQKE